MLGNAHFYNRTIRKVVVAFGTMFNDILLQRYSVDGTTKQELFKVPLTYGSKEKYITRITSDPNLTKTISSTVPRISFEMTGMSYDSGRKQVSTLQNFSANTATGIKTQFAPIPYNFDISMSIFVRNTEDGTQILEQILPFFTPDFNVSVDFIAPMDQKYDMPVILNSVSNEVDYEGDYNTNIRSIIWTLNFTVKGYLYGPVSQPKIIRSSITNIINEPSLHEHNVTGTMATGGLGNYQFGEDVYQGYSYDTATATAKVVSWNSTSKLLELTDVFGHLTSGKKVIGVTTNATWIANSFNLTANSSVKITVAPNPSNVVMPNNYTYTITTQEYPNIT